MHRTSMCYDRVLISTLAYKYSYMFLKEKRGTMSDTVSVWDYEHGVYIGREFYILCRPGYKYICHCLLAPIGFNMCPALLYMSSHIITLYRLYRPDNISQPCTSYYMCNYLIRNLTYIHNYTFMFVFTYSH